MSGDIPAGDHADRVDPIEAHVAALGSVLRGADREKARMLAELREGLREAAADCLAEAGGASDEAAAREAVRQFGSVADLAPSFQRELTIAQARHTSRRILLLLPLLLPCWYLLTAAHHLPAPAQVALAHLGGTAAATALAAAAFLALTGRLARRLPTPERLPVMVAWTGTTAAVALALSALTLAAASFLASNWPLCLLACGVALTCHARIASSSRACRACARLPLPA
ncbi:permease prefix domain 1-containing protein [Streptomyces sp. NPDC047014]|uniref:permease prefix domain 1-containing protein n=1 Tax=Streptomyces sp. NPDC047014 TaxID=3155736 RepID=UPI0033D4C28E